MAGWFSGRVLGLTILRFWIRIPPTANYATNNVHYDVER